MTDASNMGAAASASEKTPGQLWSAWSEDDCDSDPRIDPMAQKVTEWFVGRWPLGAEEPECRILIGQGRSAEIVARRLAERLTSILNTDAIVAERAALPAPPPVPESVRRLSEALTEARAWIEHAVAPIRPLSAEAVAPGEALLNKIDTLLAATSAGRADDDIDRCIACDEPLKAGQRVLDDVNGGIIHAECCGPERESYAGADGEPLGPNDPIPQGYVYEPDPSPAGRAGTALAGGGVADEADASIDPRVLGMARAMAHGRAPAWEKMRYGVCTPQQHSRSYWLMLAQDADRGCPATPAGRVDEGGEKPLAYEADRDGAWTWLVWAISPAGAHLAVIGHSEAKAESYRDATARLYPGARVHIERAPVDHTFGASDLRSVAYRAAIKDARRQGKAGFVPCKEPSPAPAPDSGRVAEGYRLVPVEPTDAQLRAARNAWLADPERRSSTLYRAMIDAAPAPAGATGEGWRDDPSADDRWNAGLDYGQQQLCAVLGVDPASVSWDAATETLDGDVRSVIGNILTAWAGDGWRDVGPAPSPAGEA